MPGGNSALSSPPVAPLSSSMTAAPSVSEVDVLLSMLPVMAMAILCIWAVHTSPDSPETASSAELSVFPKATVTAMNAVSELLVSIEFPIMTVDTVSELSVFHDATVMAANAVYELFVSIESPIMTADTVSELSVCHVSAKKASYELSAGSAMAKEATGEPSDCPVMAMKAICELSACPFMA